MSIFQSYILYYFIIVATSLIVLLSSRFKNNLSLSRVIFLIALILPVFISGLRYGIGTDYFNYEAIYYELTNSGSVVDNFLNTRYEPGWILLNHIVKFIFNDVKYVFILSSILIWVFNFKAIYDNRNKISISIAVLILLCTSYNQSFNMVRQALAAAILMLSIKPIVNKKPLKFIITVLISTMFHYTAIIFLPIYWIVNSKIKALGLWKKILTFIGVGLAVILAPTLLKIVTNYEAFEYFSHYDLNFQNFGIGNIIIKLPVILIILLNIRKLNSTNPISKLVIVYFLSLLLEYIGYFAAHVSRIAIYYEMMQIFILAAIVKTQQNKYERLFYSFLIFIYFLGWFTYQIIYLNNHETVPYIWL